MHSTSIYSCQSEKDVRVKELDQQPLDSIQCIYWDRNEGCRFIVGGWDGVLRFYSMNFSPMFLEQNYCTFLEEPILCCTMDRSYLAYTGHSDGFIRATNIPTNQTVVFGKHEGAAVKDVYWV
jgi:WD40 repeat protein